MVCKKTALYSLASSPERKVPGSKPAEKSLNGVSRIQSEPPSRSSSLGAATKSKEKEKESRTESKCKSLSPAKEATKKYKKRSTISPQKRSSSPEKDVDDGATASKRPKRQAAISAATVAILIEGIQGEGGVTLATPEYLLGVINLRGTIVPIVDMRIKFNVGQVEYTPFTVVIILNIAGRVVGIVVDSVSDVTMLRQDQIRPAPEFAATVDTKYINGLGTLGERMLIVVDIEKLMISSEMALVDEASAG